MDPFCSLSYLVNTSCLERTIFIEDNELATQTPLEEEEEDGEIFLNSEDEYEWLDDERRFEASKVARECVLLRGAIAFDRPPRPPQQQLNPPPPVLTSFLTKDGYIDDHLVATRAVIELPALALDSNSLFWTKEGILNQRNYQITFPRPKPPKRKRTSTPNANSWTHASRSSAIVKMEHSQLAKMLTDEKNWEKLFPSIVSKSIGLRFLSKGSSSRNPDGFLQLVQIQLQATTPIVPRRTFVILRTCKKIDELTWVVADVSVDSSLNVGYPCGCLIQGIADGSSQVTWVEHLELEPSYLDPKLYNDLCCRGFAFGAERWVACLERSCERRSHHRPKSELCLLPRLVGQDLMDFEKRCVMTISKRMVRDFCLKIVPLCGQPGQPIPSCVPLPSQAFVYLKVRKSCRYIPRKVVFFATTTFSLPYSPEFVLRILGDESRRHELDASGRIGRLTEVTCYTTGDDPRNKISVQANQSFHDELLLQETSVSPSGSLVVWSLLTNEPFVVAKRGGIPRHCPLFGLSGVAISSNSLQNTTSSSSNTGGGSVITLGLQQQVDTGRGPESTKVVIKYMQDTVDRIVAVLNNLKEGVHSSTNKRKRNMGDCLQ